MIKFEITLINFIYKMDKLLFSKEHQEQRCYNNILNLIDQQLDMDTDIFINSRKYPCIIDNSVCEKRILTRLHEKYKVTITKEPYTYIHSEYYIHISANK